MPVNLSSPATGVLKRPICSMSPKCGGWGKGSQAQVLTDRIRLSTLPIQLMEAGSYNVPFKARKEETSLNKRSKLPHFAEYGLVNSSTVICWTSPLNLVILGVLGLFCCFHSMVSLMENPVSKQCYVVSDLGRH